MLHEVETDGSKVLQTKPQLNHAQMISGNLVALHAITQHAP